MDAWIGIDVAKDTLDVCLQRSAGKPLSRQFPNNAAGHSKLLRWVNSQVQGSAMAPAACHFCMESTGPYSLPLAEYLVEQEQRVSVVNPAHIKYYGMAKGILNKTDRVDARLIAHYCRQEEPAPWRLSLPHVRQLMALMRRLEQVQVALGQEKARLDAPALDPLVTRSLKRVIRGAEREIRRLQAEIDAHIEQHPDLRDEQELLESIPGIGQTLARWILAELPDTQQLSDAKSAAAYAGLNPMQHTSGTSVRRPARISRTGNAHLRRALYMPTLAALRCNPLVRALYERLLERGLSKMAAVAAGMRKLLMLAYGVLRSRVPFDAEHASTPRCAREAAPCPTA